MKKFSWKTLVVAILFVCLIGYSIFSLNALPSTPVEADFDSTEAFSQAMDQYLANKKQVHAYITVGVLCVSALGFALEAAPVAVIAMVMPIFFGLTGILPVSEAFSGFSNSTVILFAGMFILGSAMFRTGLAQKIGMFVVKLFSGSETKLCIGVMLLTSLMSAFLSNTGTVAVLLPVCMGIADSQGWSRAKLLMPMAIMSSAGGMCTMIGTPPNLTVNAVLSTYGYETMGFFDFAWFGLPATILAILYFAVIGKKMIPERPHSDIAAQTANTEAHDPVKQLISGIVLVVVVIMMALDIIDLSLVAACGALICVIAGCLTEKQAYQAIDWSTIFLFAGALSLANAMSVTGAGSIIANLCIKAMGGNPSPYLLFTVLFIVCGVLTQFMSNTASAALLCPIGLEIAATLGVSPLAVVLAMGYSASAAYFTPVATPPNTVICGPANLKFMDFIKIGFPLFLLTYLLALVIIPWKFPFVL